jgi:hypothetical protein
VADGYTMPAGCIKVALENGSVKYVSCLQNCKKHQKIIKQLQLKSGLW